MGSVSSEAEEDRISGLPDEILVHILSFLPIEEAIKTTLLRRFGNLWRSLPRLTFDTRSSNKYIYEVDHPNYNDKFNNLIHHLLILHRKGEIDELRLVLPFRFEYSKYPGYSTNPDPQIKIHIIRELRFAGVIDSLVSFAITKRCKVLYLDFLHFLNELQHGYLLPAIVYTSIYLTQLTLCFGDITSCDHEVCLKSLKLLHFSGVVMTDEAMEKILLGCPSLEELSVEACYGLRNLCCSNNIKLKKLKIEHAEHKLITLSYLNVLSLTILGSWIESVVVLKSTIVYATLYSLFMFQYGRRSYEGFKCLLQSLDQCETFRPCIWSVTVLAIWELTNIPCPYFNWKHLVLELSLKNCVQVGLCMLLRHVPLMETVTIHVRCRPLDVVKNDEGVEEYDSDEEFEIDQARWLEEYELDEDKYWNEAEASLENLKIVVIHGDCIAADSAVIHVAKFLLRNAVALEKMVISKKENVNPNGPSYIFTRGGMVEPEKDGLLTDEMTCVLENLLTSPKASTKAVIHFT